MGFPCPSLGGEGAPLMELEETQRRGGLLLVRVCQNPT
jgi:hypothetical protein